MLSINWLSVIAALTFLVGCKSDESFSGLLKISDSEGEIEAVLINLTDPTITAPAHYGQLLDMVGPLTDSMKVVLHSYVDLSPAFYHSYAQFWFNNQDICPENPADDNLFQGYLNWLASVSDDSIYAKKIRGLINSFIEPDVSWRHFSTHYDEVMADKSHQRVMPNVKSKTFLEIIALNETVVQEQLAEVDSFYAHVKRVLTERQLANLTLLRSEKKEAFEILKDVCPDACNPCDSCQNTLSSKNPCVGCGNCRFREIEWVQDRILVGHENGVLKSCINCRNEFSLEAALISSKLQANGFIDSIVGLELCFEGGNVFRAKGLIIAKDEIAFSAKTCEENGVSTRILNEKFKNLFNNQPLHWLQISPGKGPVGRFNCRINPLTKELGLPLHHMDLFLNFGLNNDGEWTAFLGKVDTAYYTNNFVVTVLNKADKTYMNTLENRLKEVGRVMDSLNYKIVRVPLVLVYGRGDKASKQPHEILAVLSYNNALMECYKKGDNTWVRNAYLTKYDFSNEVNVSDSGLDTAQIFSDVRLAYAGYNISWIGGRYRLKTMSGIRCYSKVLSRLN